MVAKRSKGPRPRQHQVLPVVAMGFYGLTELTDLPPSPARHGGSRVSEHAPAG